METIKCLEVLGLKRGYSKEELTKTYRSLAKKYHPDSLRGCSKTEWVLANEKMKEINEAHDTLVKRNYPFSSFNSSFINSKPRVDISSAYNKYTVRDRLIKKIRQCLKDIEKILKENDSLKVLESYKIKFDDLASEISNYIRGDVTLEEYDDKFTKLFKQLLKDFKSEFFQVNYIDESDEISLSYDVNLIKFYESLKELVPKYGRYYKFNEKFEAALLDFKTHEYYEALKNYVESKSSFLREEAYKREFKDVDYIINALKQLLSKLYSKYEEFDKRLNSIINGYRSLYGEDIIDSIQMISSGFDFIDNIKYLLLLKDHFMESKDYSYEFDICEKDLEKRVKLKQEIPHYFEMLVNVQRKFIFEYQRRLKANKSVTNLKREYYIFLEIITLIINYNLNLDDFLELYDLDISNLEEVTLILKNLLNRCRELLDPYNVSSLKMNPSDFI